MGVAMVLPMPAVISTTTRKPPDDITQHIVTRVLDQFGPEYKKGARHWNGLREAKHFHRRIKMAFDDLEKLLQALDEARQLLKN